MLSEKLRSAPHPAKRGLAAESTPDQPSVLARPLLNFVEDHDPLGTLASARDPSTGRPCEGASWDEVEYLLEWDLSPAQVGLIVLAVVAACLLPGVLSGARGLLAGLM